MRFLRTSDGVGSGLLTNWLCERCGGCTRAQDAICNLLEAAKGPSKSLFLTPHLVGLCVSLITESGPHSNFF